MLIPNRDKNIMPLPLNSVKGSSARQPLKVRETQVLVWRTTCLDLGVSVPSNGMTKAVSLDIFLPDNRVNLCSL